MCIRDSCHGIEKSELTRIKTRGMICLLQNHHSSHKRVRTQWHRNPSHTTVYIHMYTYICMCTMCIHMYMYTEVQTCTLTRMCTILYSQVDKPLICSTYKQHTQHDNEDVLKCRSCTLLHTHLQTQVSSQCASLTAITQFSWWVPIDFDPTSVKLGTLSDLESAAQLRILKACNRDGHALHLLTRTWLWLVLQSIMYMLTGPIIDM